MKQRKNKIEYEKPKLIVLKGTVGRTEGTCAPGSGDSGNCYEGTNAYSVCSTGTGFTGCFFGALDASCRPNGGTPSM